LTERLKGPRLIVVKIGTTSIVDEAGAPDITKVKAITDQVGALARQGTSVVIVTSGAIAAGRQALGLPRATTDMPTLQAAAAVGQRMLMDMYSTALDDQDLKAGQVLLTHLDIVHRRQYLNARHTLERLIALRCVPIVNENDTVAVEEIRYGDNDRLAALVANIVRASLLVMLSDVDGLYDADPSSGRRSSSQARLLDTVDEITPEMYRGARGRSGLGSGGMSVKLEAARMAVFSGVATVIASAARPGVLLEICEGKTVGTYFPPNKSPVQARKLWIAWAPSARGRIVVDEGAVSAVTERNKSLLAAGITAVEGSFKAGDAVEVAGHAGKVFAKGLVGFDSAILTEMAGTKGGREVIHRNQLVVL